ncbi:MAG: hypothetical protein M1524_00140 [Patescibacteria group bacterium]|nr:hypothetical protein [Patescibacteria group bacterium]
MKKQNSNKFKGISGKDREKIGKKIVPSDNSEQEIRSSIWTGKIFDILLITLIVAIGLACIDLYGTYKNKKADDFQRQVVKNEIAFWQGILEKHSDYRDAYFKVSLLEYKLGNMKRSSYYLQKTLALDPNFEAGREFEKVLDTKN